MNRRAAERVGWDVLGMAFEPLFLHFFRSLVSGGCDGRIPTYLYNLIIYIYATHPEKSTFFCGFGRVAVFQLD
jgi:hypothetical protein